MCEGQCERLPAEHDMVTQLSLGTTALQPCRKSRVTSGDPSLRGCSNLGHCSTYSFPRTACNTSTLMHIASASPEEMRHCPSN